jgi:hypothetical protein
VHHIVTAAGLSASGDRSLIRAGRGHTLRATSQESYSMRLCITDTRTPLVTTSRRASIVRVRLLSAVLATTALVGACGTSASDREADALLPTDGTTVTTTTTTTRATTPAGTTTTTTAPVRRTVSESTSSPAAASTSRAREVTLPTGTALALRLGTAVASDTSRVEDGITAELTSAVVVDGRTVLPAGATVAGIVSGVEDSGRVKGRASLELNFTSLSTGGTRYTLSAMPVSRRAAATKGEDATKVGIGAGAGAVIGGILGGKKGAAQGAVVGGGAGTGVVLATRGQEVRLAAGSDVSTELSRPLTVRVLN